MEGRWGMFDIRSFALKQNIQIELPLASLLSPLCFCSQLSRNLRGPVGKNQICSSLVLTVVIRCCNLELSIELSELPELPRHSNSRMSRGRIEFCTLGQNIDDARVLIGKT